jgi:hypothetical protein
MTGEGCPTTRSNFTLHIQNIVTSTDAVFFFSIIFFYFSKLTHEIYINCESCADGIGSTFTCAQLEQPKRCAYDSFLKTKLAQLLSSTLYSIHGDNFHVSRNNFIKQNVKASTVVYLRAP